MNRRPRAIPLVIGWLLLQVCVQSFAPSLAVPVAAPASLWRILTQPPRPLGNFYPCSFAPDAHQHLYVSNGGNVQVREFTTRGKLLRKWGNPEFGPGIFHDDSTLSVGPHGNIWVASPFDNTIQELSPAGRPILMWGSPLSQRFSRPRSAVQDSHGDVYVADSLGVHKLNQTGAQLALWKSTPRAPGGQSLEGPCGLAIGGSGDVFVADAGHNRVVEFSPNGQALHVYRDPPTTADDREQRDYLYPTAVAVDHSGDVWVTYPNWPGVDEFAPGGKIIRQWNRAALEPSGVAIAPDRRVYVADESVDGVIRLPPTDHFPSATFYAPIHDPYSIAISHTGMLYVAASAPGDPDNVLVWVRQTSSM